MSSMSARRPVHELGQLVTDACAFVCAVCLPEQGHTLPAQAGKDAEAVHSSSVQLNETC